MRSTEQHDESSENGSARPSLNVPKGSGGRKATAPAAKLRFQARADLNFAHTATVPDPVGAPAGAGDPAGRAVPTRAATSGAPARMSSPPRPVYAEDSAPAEYRAAAVSGWCALLVGLFALAGTGWFLWTAGAVSRRWTDALGIPAAPRWQGLRSWGWAVIASWGFIALLAFAGLTRGRNGTALVLTSFGRYRGTVRRTGLVWISPFILRRRVDVRVRHWRSQPMSAIDPQGVELRVVVFAVWQVKDTARATFGVDDHIGYLRKQMEATLTRVLSRLPMDIFSGAGPSLRDVASVGDTLAERLAAECAPAGLEVFSVQPTSIEYAPGVAAAMYRRQAAVLESRHRESVLDSVVSAVEDTVTGLTRRGLVEFDSNERQAFVKELTIAFYSTAAR
ncbi:SPFH domain-containing protein [Streptomyces xanthochromogenes]|uniref:SPFH domain-containing protein n=1 Tax=Streptomyces xanthochromogenes TaxID=67384 RepID=UPI003441B1C4